VSARKVFCKHWVLPGECRVCELEAEVKRLREALEKARADLMHVRNEALANGSFGDVFWCSGLGVNLSNHVARALDAADYALTAAEKPAEKEEPRAPGRCELPYPVVAKDRREFDERHGEVK